MSPRTIRFTLGAAIFLAFVLAAVFPVLGGGDADDPATACTSCTLMEVGLVDVDNTRGIVTAIMSFAETNSEKQATLYVYPQSFRSFYLDKGRWLWRAVWIDPILYNVHEWDWGYVYVKPGSRASISLNPHGKAR